MEIICKAQSRHKMHVSQTSASKLNKAMCHFPDEVTAPYAHSQNGKAERFIRTLEDGFQTLLADSGLPMSFWGDATLTINYLHNRIPTSVVPAVRGHEQF